MNDANDQQCLSVAKWAFFLFIFGLLAPPVLVLLVLAFSSAEVPWEAVNQAVPFAVALGLIAEVLALVLGIVGRRYVAGKIAWIGAAVLVGLALATGWFMFMSETKIRRNPSSMSRVHDEEPPVPRPDRAEDKGPAEVQASRVPPTSSPAETPRPVPKAPTTLPAGAGEGVKRQDEAAKALGVNKEAF